jgi:hypothetical protein
VGIIRNYCWLLSSRVRRFEILFIFLGYVKEMNGRCCICMCLTCTNSTGNDSEDRDWKPGVGSKVLAGSNLGLLGLGKQMIQVSLMSLVIEPVNFVETEKSCALTKNKSDLFIYNIP